MIYLYQNAVYIYRQYQAVLRSEMTISYRDKQSFWALLLAPVPITQFRFWFFLRA